MPNVLLLGSVSSCRQVSAPSKLRKSPPDSEATSTLFSFPGSTPIVLIGPFRGRVSTSTGTFGCSWLTLKVTEMSKRVAPAPPPPPPQDESKNVAHKNDKASVLNTLRYATGFFIRILLLKSGSR